MKTITLGVYVIGVRGGRTRNAFTASSVTQVSFDPVLLAVAIGKDHASRSLLHLGGGFTVNVLRHDQIDLARHFGTVSGRDVDKLAAIRWRPGRTGAPIIEEALAYFDCTLVSTVPAGDHELIVGNVIGGELLSIDGAPLLYSDTGNLDGATRLYPSRFAPADAAGY
jgi:flavin reductase (DIM6/NTAB) family NADH-FMN oxidoreductase RutF